MSMLFLDDQPWSATPGYLAGAVRAHRAAFRISLEEAAERAEVTVERWRELEAGTWIPAVDEVQVVTRGLRGAELLAVAFWAQCSRAGVDMLCHCQD